ncbi:uncharacterized protein F5147DRAFT_808287 [Suillus discolor]|uniref:Nephrocystin 3-like N-terminal domain-containing protein n=1 Tax=Suillus discolor TaxID=1912936 RepID=A0A9P7F3Z5_9AGAM|nr:uncharacterized protein F5147DRAFT_808287 [Suillus discolor]KAG2104047.1 hypothetical protein F5147DRAFT_808287 [Suillus discolor]
MNDDNQLGNSRSVPPLDIETRHETNAAERPGRPRGKICRFLGKVTNDVITSPFSEISVDTQTPLPAPPSSIPPPSPASQPSSMPTLDSILHPILNHLEEVSERVDGCFARLGGEIQWLEKCSNSKDLRSRDPVLPNVDHEGSSIPNIEVQPATIQDASTGVKQGADPQSVDVALRDAYGGANALLGPIRSVASAGQNAPAALDDMDSMEATYLQPLRIFDTVHPYAKMALGVLSCALKIILAQVDRNEAILDLYKKLGQVYGFMTQDDTLDQILLMSTILGQISQQILECAHFIRDYSEKKNFWKRLGKNVVSETDDTIQWYNNVLDALMQNFRDQVARDVAIYIHHTGEILDLSGMAYVEATGLDTRKRCLPGTHTDILSNIMRWINNSEDDAPRVLWLSGPAGTGKSAIAHTIASSFIGVFSTITRDLADRHPQMRQALADAVRNTNALKTTADVVQQWQELLIEPLGKLSESPVGPVMIVIDALDESGKAVETRSDLLRILAGKLQDPTITHVMKLLKNFRIIVTSHPLHDIEAAFSEHDIHAYIMNQLEEFLDFGDTQFAVLAKKADGLFEWAHLACKSIKAPPPGLSSSESFDAVVSCNPAERENLLYDMYDFILTEIMQINQSPRSMSLHKQLTRFCSVMGQILGAAEPLSLESLNVIWN